MKQVSKTARCGTRSGMNTDAMAKNTLRFKGELEREEDGRWIACIPSVPGVMAYGSTKVEAMQQVFSLLLDAVSDQVAHGEIQIKAQKTQSLQVAYN
jgi:predicted RNase H-like HicB family nuclease